MLWFAVMGMGALMTQTTRITCCLHVQDTARAHSSAPSASNVLQAPGHCSCHPLLNCDSERETRENAHPGRGPGPA